MAHRPRKWQTRKGPPTKLKGYINPANRTRRSAAPIRCQALAQGDEYFCPCGLRWDTHEDRPPCPQV